jgi:hypothetical protein
MLCDISPRQSPMSNVSRLTLESTSRQIVLGILANKRSDDSDLGMISESNRITCSPPCAPLASAMCVLSSAQRAGSVTVTPSAASVLPHFRCRRTLQLRGCGGASVRKARHQEVDARDTLCSYQAVRQVSRGPCGNVAVFLLGRPVPNHAFDWTARKRRLRIPSSLRSSAAGQRGRSVARRLQHVGYHAGA